MHLARQYARLQKIHFAHKPNQYLRWQNIQKPSQPYKWSTYLFHKDKLNLG